MAHSNEMLDKEFNKLKEIFHYPRLYLSNHFSDLKSEIDMAFARKRDQLTVSAKKAQLDEHFTQMINKLSSYEQECMKFQKTHEYASELQAETQESIKTIENKLTNQLDEYLIKEISDLIYDQITKLQKVLFLNKSVIFLDRSKCYHMADNNNTDEESENKNLFDEMDPDTTVGKLICINNEYFGQRAINILKK